MIMTTGRINELRDYIYGLKQTRAKAPLEDSIRFAGKFEGATGTRVAVTVGDEGFAANDRLPAEVFQMTTEALRNIHRRTQARRAQVTLNFQSNSVILQVENESDDVVSETGFSPTSISERAETIAKVEVAL